ncbi:MAG: S24/S26 family peptidase [Clostridia bacterium]|nr:S24/S26 family peptidase [Clostridia bacterium]
MDKNSCPYQTAIETNGVLAFVPHGNSMWPFFKSGKQTVIIVKNKDRLELLDVALYKTCDGQVVLHRVVGVLDDGYIMQGDSLFKSEKILESQVIGVMDSFYKGKRILSPLDPKYVKKVKKWYKGGKTVNFRKKLFHFFADRKQAK